LIPNSPDPYRRAAAAFEMGQLGLAERLVGEALTVDPSDHQLFRLLAQIRMEQGRLPEARDCCHRALSINATDVPALLALAWSTAFDANYPVKQGGDGLELRFEKARAISAQARELMPDEPVVWQMEALFDLALDQYPEAEQHARQGLSHAGDDQHCLEALIQALCGQGKLDEAQPVARQLLSNSPESPTAHGLVSRICLERGDAQQALYHATEAVRLNPTSEEARQHFWDAIKARSVFLRPIVRLQFFAQRFQQKHRERQYGVALLAIGVFVAIGYLLKLAFGISPGPWCAVAGLWFGLMLASDRPAMAIADIWMLHDRNFRRMMDTRHLLNHLFGGAALILFCLVLVGTSGALGTSAIVVVTAFPFAYSLLRFATCDSAQLKIAFVIQMLVMAGLLGHVVYAFTRPLDDPSSRIWGAGSGVFFVVAAFAGLAMQDKSDSVLQK
jgi:tetratricopeptide (TPR) repeat protein